MCSADLSQPTCIRASPRWKSWSLSGFGVKLVVTQPDRPSGRGMEAGSLAGETCGAGARTCPSSSRRKSRTTRNFARNWSSIAPEAIIVVGYGRIIPQWMIDLPPLGNINLHGSLLPKYRGAAPIQWAIARGETVTGVTTMRIDAGLDTGDILQQAEERIGPEDTAATLAPRLAQTGAELMISTLAGLKNGTITRSTAGRLSGHARARSSNVKTGSSTSRTRLRMPGTACADFSRGRARTPIFAASCCTCTLRSRLRTAAVLPGHFTVENERLLLGFSHATVARRSRAADGGQEADERAGFHQRVPAEERRRAGPVAIRGEGEQCRRSLVVVVRFSWRMRLLSGSVFSHLASR